MTSLSRSIARPRLSKLCWRTCWARCAKRSERSRRMLGVTQLRALSLNLCLELFAPWEICSPQVRSLHQPTKPCSALYPTLVEFEVLYRRNAHARQLLAIEEETTASMVQRTIHTFEPYDFDCGCIRLTFLYIVSGGLDTM